MNVSSDDIVKASKGILWIFKRTFQKEAMVRVKVPRRKQTWHARGPAGMLGEGETGDRWELRPRRPLTRPWFDSTFVLRETETIKNSIEEALS